MTHGRSLIVLRHGQTTQNASGIYQGHTDTEMSVRGLEQAESAAGVLAPRAPVRIVSSDLRRAVVTAHALGKATGLTVEIDPDLREIDVGSWAGLSHAEVQARYPRESSAIAAGLDRRRGEDGETVAEVGSRTRRVAEGVAGSLEQGQCAVVVTHGMAARVMAATLTGWPPSEAVTRLPALSNCCWGELRVPPERWSVLSWNVGDQDSATAPI
ncbi:histidine phosphatase family protein [soil metagenome]